MCGGCSFSYQMDSMFKPKRDADVETAGSIRPPAPGQQAAAAMPPDGELDAARAAVSEALGRAGQDASVPWEDPATGARGTVTALSNAYSQDGATCRDFLASYVRNGSEAWLQGEPAAAAGAAGKFVICGAGGGREPPIGQYVARRRAAPHIWAMDWGKYPPMTRPGELGDARPL